MFPHAQSYKEQFLLAHQHQRQQKRTSNSRRAATREESLISIADAIRPHDPGPGDALVAMRRGHSVSQDEVALCATYLFPIWFDMLTTRQPNG
jgi:hypothetical protein